MIEPGLDYAFLRYIGGTSEGQKQHQRVYLSFFAERQTVIDLGCGEGDFIELLGENGITGIGVDSDPLACDAALKRGLDVNCQDVFDYLTSARPESVDGIFASHLVEHLPYEQVLELMRLSCRVLKPGGVIVLTTPNVSSLFAHLEMFYLHFGHVSFYHPRLLSFFLEHVGFVNVEMGENASPVLPARPIFGALDTYPIRVELPLWQNTWLHRMVRRLRMTVARLFAQPYLDIINHNFDRIQDALERVDRPFECYVKAVKKDEQAS